MKSVSGSDLQKGDTITVCWGNKRETIRSFETRAGGHPDLRRIAKFESGKGMTICEFERYQVI